MMMRATPLQRRPARLPEAARRAAFIQPRRTAKKASAVMQENEADRERRLRELASKLLFTIERRGSRFALYRDVDVPKPVGHDDLTLDEVEDILNTWKLRGPHGG
jgi:hypothetical protein